MTNKINGIDVSEWELKGVLIPITECKYFEGIGDCKESKGLCVDNENCYFKQLKRLQKENEKIKKQYNCYACGSCNGKEDYINLEKHHKGLRKNFDELAKRNNTLSLRIEELEKENEGLKNTPRLELDTSYIREKELECIKYKQALEEIRKEVQEDITCESRECGCDSYYECLECLKNTILNIISEVKEDGNSRKTSNAN